MRDQLLQIEPLIPAVRLICSYRIGRICLHAAAMVGDRQFKWHLAGIRRELSGA